MPGSVLGTVPGHAARTSSLNGLMFCQPFSVAVSVRPYLPALASRRWLCGNALPLPLVFLVGCPLFSSPVFIITSEAHLETILASIFPGISTCTHLFFPYTDILLCHLLHFFNNCRHVYKVE